jgi:hypothetical protein
MRNPKRLRAPGLERDRHGTHEKIQGIQQLQRMRLAGDAKGSEMKPNLAPKSRHPILLGAIPFLVKLIKPQDDIEIIHRLAWKPRGK